MYEVIITQPFVAAHRLRLHDGTFEPLHGHNWKMEVRLQGLDLDSTEILIDFLEVKAKVQAILKEIDYSYLNENLRLEGHNPSAEIIARWLYQKIKSAVSHPAARVSKVTVWETDDCAASYLEE